jgi:hypothetical protein
VNNISTAKSGLLAAEKKGDDVFCELFEQLTVRDVEVRRRDGQYIIIMIMRT